MKAGPFLSLVLLAGTWSCSPDPASEGVVASVLGASVSLVDLGPSAEVMQRLRQFNTAGETDSVLIDRWRGEELSRIVWKSLLADFASDHDIEPSFQELDTLCSSFLRDSTDPLDTLGERTRRDACGRFIGQWKTSRALYEEYGGVVIFQQSNPFEPVGAYRQFLEEHERDGNLRIHDPALRERFWTYYVRDHPFKVPESDIDFSQPWWVSD